MATKVQTNLIKINLKAGNKVLAAYIALVASMSKGNTTTFPDGTVGTEVYLDNAYNLVKDGMTRNEWAGCLSALTEQGKYMKQGDNSFGLVLCKQEK